MPVTTLVGSTSPPLRETSGPPQRPGKESPAGHRASAVPPPNPRAAGLSSHDSMLVGELARGLRYVGAAFFAVRLTDRLGLRIRDRRPLARRPSNCGDSGYSQRMTIPDEGLHRRRTAWLDARACDA